MSDNIDVEISLPETKIMGSMIITCIKSHIDDEEPFAFHLMSKTDANKIKEIDAKMGGELLGLIDEELKQKNVILAQDVKSAFKKFLPEVAKKYSAENNSLGKKGDVAKYLEQVINKMSVLTEQITKKIAIKAHNDLTLAVKKLGE